MTVKYTPNVIKKDKGQNPFRISDRYSLSSRPVNVPLHFKNLKANTKYKLFLQNNEGSAQEDITPFCTPYGASILNNNATLNNGSLKFNEFVSNDSGELFVNARPFGVENVDLDGTNWNRHWRYSRNKSKSADVGRQNFIIVESAKVDSVANPADKVKTINDIVYPVSFDIEPEVSNTQLKVKQQIRFDYIQTFFVDPNRVENAQTVDITDVTLYFRNKPDRRLNTRNRLNPGVTLALIDVENDRPVVEKQYRDSIVTQSWSTITASSTAEVGTIFEFTSPIRLEPGKFYAIAVSFDDPDYILWSSVRGDVLVNTEEISPGSSKEHRGVVYTRTNAGTVLNNKNFDSIFTKKEDTDLKFDIHVAEYNLAANVDIKLVNIDQEFLSITNTTNNWVGSEFVYKQTANSTGTVAVTAGGTTLTGTSTTFTDDLTKDARIVLQQGSNTQIVEIGSVLSDTSASIKQPALFSMTAGGYKVTPTGRVDHYDYVSKLLFLKESTANSSLYFDDGDTIIGIESGEEVLISKVGAFPVSTFSSNFGINLPNEFDLTSTFRFAVQDASNSQVFAVNATATDLKFFEPNHIRDYGAVVVSRSLEARNEDTMFDQDGLANTSDGKSVLFNLDFTFDGTDSTSYVSPVIDISQVSLATKQWKINNDTTNEHTNNGNALTKHISKRLVLQEGQVAEDIRVIQNAYRPLGTDVKVYAKILNVSDPDAFEDKNWTELTRISGENEFSEKNNFEDFREFEYTFPSEIPSDETLDGTATTSSGCNVITGVGTTFNTTLANGDVIKLYSPLFEDNYGYFSIVSVDSATQITVNEAITNNDIIGSGFKVDTVTTPQTAFLNPLNLNIVRYFGAEGESYDGYSVVAIKTVLLSEDALVTPRVDDNRIISVSA